MKINKIIKALSLLLVVAFAACSDFEDTVIDSPERPAGNLGVFFPANPSLFELEPTDEPKITLKIAREISAGAVQVPVKVEINDENIFNVPQSVSFADGQKEVEFNVTFPEAKEGVAYDLKLVVEGDTYVNPYGSPLNYVSTTVSRIKWSPVPRPLVYIDGTFATLFGVQFYPMYVEADSVKLDESTRYRFKNAYRVPTSDDPDEDGIFDGYPYNSPGDFDDSQDWLTTIEIYENGKVFMGSSEIGVDWGYGMISIGNLLGNTSQTDESAYPLGKFENNVITFGANSLYFSMAGYSNGGKYAASNPTTIYLSKEAYIAANLKIEDFNDVEYELVEGELGTFESAAYSDIWSRTLSQAIDLDVDNEDSDYKSLFYISDLYAEDYGLAFYNYDGVIRIPENQPTGIEFLGNEVFVSQSPKHSSSVYENFKGTSVYTFGLIFHYKDGTIVGDFAETYYYSEEALTYVKDDFLGNFSLIGATEPLDVVIDENTDNNFVITGIKYADAVKATFDSTEVSLTIVPQALADTETADGVYEAVLYTVIPAGASGSAPLKFEFNLRGDLVVSESSIASGFRIRGFNVEDEDDQLWLHSNLKPIFIVQESEDALSSSIESYALRTTIVDKFTGSGPNFFKQGKKSVNAKTLKNEVSAKNVY
ncbi:MAG: hypothetical protein PHV53_00790 [Fermentimonas sp.]|nr:hypothetical protein [Fermentimonas sp.]